MKILALVSLSSLLLGAACGGEDACDPSVPGTICTIVGGGGQGYDGDDPVPALGAKLNLPQDVLTGGDGTLYVADWNNHRLRRVTPDGMIEWIAGQGEIGGETADLSEEPEGDFNHLTSLIWDCQTGEDLVIAAWHNSKIRTLDLDTGDIVDTCGDGRRAYFGDGGPAETAALDLPASVACDPAGNLVVMDQANQVIRRIEADGTVTRIAGSCVIDAAPPNGPGACDAPVQCPGGSGKWTCGDPATTCMSACTPSYNGENVPALEMRMGQPFGQSAPPAGRMVYEPDGSLLFADTSNHIIRRIRASDGMVETVAGSAPVDGVKQSGYGGDGGPATAALLDSPTDLALGEDGSLYFTDRQNHCVRVVRPDGTIETFAGQCGAKGFEGDGGDPADALLKLPYGIHIADGVLYIVDTGNHRIRTVILE